MRQGMLKALRKLAFSAIKKFKEHSHENKFIFSCKLLTEVASHFTFSGSLQLFKIKCILYIFLNKKDVFLYLCIPSAKSISEKKMQYC